MIGALLFAGQAAFWIFQAHLWAFNVWQFTKNKKAWAAICELRPFVLVAIPIKAFFYDFPLAHSHADLALVVGLLWPLDAIWWWIVWKHKDDRWTKRRKKALTRVQEVAGKLVVVPVPQPVAITSREYR